LFDFEVFVYVLLSVSLTTIIFIIITFIIISVVLFFQLDWTLTYSFELTTQFNLFD